MVHERDTPAAPAIGQATPGPWLTDRAVTSGAPLIYSIGRAGRRISIARLMRGKLGQPKDEAADANARLIIAAPDVLEQLQIALGILSRSDNWHDDKRLDPMRAAIAKATMWERM